MTFKDYLETQGINNNTTGPEAYVYAAISVKPDITYRQASLIFVDVPVVSETFETLWCAFEDALDRQNYEREHIEPVHVAIITGQVLNHIAKQMQRDGYEANTND